MEFEKCEISSADSPDCCAVLLRGGRSRRMGVDKASLPWKDGLTFLQAVAAQMDFLSEKYLSVAAEPFAAEPFGSRRAEELSGAGFPAAQASATERQRLESPQETAQSLSADWIVLPDRVPDCGPMGGIWTALTVCRAQWALAASCDIPAVQRSLFDLLLRERDQDRAQDRDQNQERDRNQEQDQDRERARERARSQEQARKNIDLIYPVTPDGRMHLTCALYRKTIAPVLEQLILQGDYRMRSLLSLCSCRAVSVEDPSLVRMLSNVNTEEDLRRLL